MARFILNSAVITSPGLYSYRLVSPEEAREWLRQGEFTSTVGYEETAAVLSEMMGLPILVNRIQVQMQPGDEALVFRLVLPPGSPRIDPHDKGRILEILGARHFELGLLRRVE